MTSAGDETRAGGCLCGAVRFETRGPLRPVVFCHCEQCRRQSGLYYAATAVPEDRIFVTGDSLAWYRSSQEAQRGFCRNCGSLLFWKRLDADRMSILAGAFDQPSELVASHHIFTADKADFYEICDGLQRFERGDAGPANPSDGKS